MSLATYHPKKINNTVNSIFNSSDYAVSGNDLKYVKLTGSSMTGALACLGLNTVGNNIYSGSNQFNTNISLPSVYNALPNNAVPTISQLGGINKQIATPIPYVANVKTNIKTISLNQGCYLLIYRVVLTNSSGANVTINPFSASVSTTNFNLDDDFRESNYATQTIPTTAQTSLSGCFYYQLGAGTSVTLYLNYFATASASVDEAGYVQAVRIG